LSETGLFNGLRQKKLKKSPFYLRLHADRRLGSAPGRQRPFRSFHPTTGTISDRVRHRGEW